MNASPRRPDALARRALVLLATVALAAGCVTHVPRERSLLAYAGADVAPVLGGELRLALPAAPPPGGLGPVIGFPLRHTDVHTRVVGTLAISTVEQVFENPLTHATDAVYVFPLGAHAAISAYRIEIGARVIEGVIQKRAQARATYEQAHTAGHTAALLEQVTANVFSQRIANLAPGETITIRFDVSEPLTLVDGQLELAFPLTVGPRYLPATHRGRTPVGARQLGDRPTEGETSIGYVDGAITGSTVSFTAEVDLPLAPSAVTSPSHDLVVEPASPGRTTIRLASHDELPNRDLIVRMRTGDSRTLVSTLAHRQGDDGYALVTIAPPAGWSQDELTRREIILLVDRSGSMEGVGLAQAQQVARTIIEDAAPGDTLNVISFADDLTRLADAPIAADELGKRDAVRFVDNLIAGGGTPLERGVLSALDEPVAPGRIRAVYLLSDGQVGDDDVVVDAARGASGTNRIYPIGIGAAPNRYLLDELARVGRGFTSYVGPTEPATTIARALVARSRAPYLTDVTIDWGALVVTDQAPALVPDVHAGLPLAIAARYRAPATGVITVHARLAGRPVTYAATVTLPAAADQPAVRLAWARTRVDDLLAGEEGLRSSPEVSAAIEQLGLTYGLVTRETSFVAVDRTRVVAPGGAEQVLEAPATMPEGLDLEQVVPTPPPKTVVRGSGVGTARELGYVNPPSSSGRGGDVDPLTLALALLLVPFALWAHGDRARRGATAGHAPWTLGVAAVALGVTALHLLGATSAAAPWMSDRAHVAASPWRLLTGPLVHATWGHVLRDVTLLVGLGLWYEPRLGRRFAPLILAGLAVPAAACLAAGADLYVGISGLTHALLAAAVVFELEEATADGRDRRRQLASLLGALLLLKVGVELAWGRAVFPMDLGPGVVQAPLAHAMGAAVGLLLAASPWRARARGDLIRAR